MLVPEKENTKEPQVKKSTAKLLLKTNESSDNLLIERKDTDESIIDKKTTSPKHSGEKLVKSNEENKEGEVELTCYSEQLNNYCGPVVEPQTKDLQTPSNNNLFQGFTFVITGLRQEISKSAGEQSVVQLKDKINKLSNRMTQLITTRGGQIVETFEENQQVYYYRSQYLV